MGKSAVYVFEVGYISKFIYNNAKPLSEDCSESGF